jgi:hypothetical protein
MAFSAPAAGQHTYTFVNSAGAVNSIAGIALTNTPTAGSILCVGVFYGGTTVPTLTVDDENGKTYAVAPNSPSGSQIATAGVVWVVYRKADGTEGKTVTAHFGTTGDIASIYVDEFAVSGGTVSFDNDAAGSGTTGTAMNTPTIPVAGAGELVYALGVPASHVTAVGAFTALEATFENFGESCAYILNQGSNKTLDWTQNSSGAWDSVGMSFKIGTSVDTGIRSSTRLRPAPFKPMGDAFRPGLYKGWR